MGQNPTIPSPVSPIFHPCNAFLTARSEHHSIAACGQIIAFDLSMYTSQRPLYWQCWKVL